MTIIGAGEFAPFTFLLEAATHLNGNVLSKALSEGFFSLLRPSGHATGGDADFTLDTIDLVFQAFNAVANIETDDDLGYNSFNEKVKVATLAAPLDFVNFFNDLVTHFASDFEANQPTEKSVKARYVHTATGLMAMACALDQPEALQLLIRTFPGTMSQELASDFTGACNASPMKALKESPARLADTRFLAPFFAIHYSSSKCLDVFSAQGWQPLAPLGNYWCSEDDGPGSFKSPLRFMDLVAEDAMLFKPSMLSKVLGLMKEDGGDWPQVYRDQLYPLALDCLNATESMSSGYVGTFLACNVYDIDLPLSLQKATVHGAIELFEHGAHPIPWADMAGNASGKEPLLVSIVRNGDIQRDAEWAELKVLDVLALARRDGAEKFFDLSTFEGGGLDFIKLLVDADMAGVLRHYLDRGLKTNIPIGGGLQSLVDVIDSAEEDNHARVKQMIRAFTARQRAFDSLEGMAKQNASSPAGMPRAINFMKNQSCTGQR